jgi:hypothetical protein
MNSQSTHQKTQFFIALSLLLIAAILSSGMGLPAYAANANNQVPQGPETTLPDYIGAPAKAHPIANSGVPQNPLLAPNPLSGVHFDPWNSDTADIAGPLGRDPSVLSSTMAEARQAPDPDIAPPWIFQCIVEFFDSHGRVVAICFSPTEATVVLADPNTLEVLSHLHLDVSTVNPYVETGRQTFLKSFGSLYSFLDADDRLIIASGGDQVWTLVEGGTEESPEFVLDEDNSYDLSWIITGDDNRLAGIMLDGQGRIWFTTPGAPGRPPRIHVLNPATYPDVKWVEFEVGEFVRNTFALTKTGVDQSTAYVVTSKKMYRVEAGMDDQPYVVWSEQYDTTDTLRDGQYELGSGTSPTILGEGKYVAITDNAEQLQVVVFRTDEQLDPNEDRIVCEMEVFDFPGGGAGALSNSLVGSRLSLIATNNYSYWFDWKTGELIESSAPGAERIDIDPNGKGCTKVWTNTEVATTTSPRLSTKTGLIYTMARELDKNVVIEGKQLDVYYWIALDFQTGETVWKKMAGTGAMFDSFYPGMGIGPNGALFYGGYGGFMSIRDTP